MEAVIDFSQEREKRRLYEFLKSRKPVKYTVAIKQHRQVRSSSANRFYWGVVLKTIAEDTGYEPDELHELFAARFLDPVEIVLKNTGEVCKVRASTRKLTDAEFAAYVEKVKAFASMELDCYIE
jgi:hypothetical protein